MGKILQGIDTEFSAHGISMILSGIDIALDPRDGMTSSIQDSKVGGAPVFGHMPEACITALKRRISKCANDMLDFEVLKYAGEPGAAVRARYRSSGSMT
ncbi:MULTISPECIES: type 1 periplasmic-binding domain-containing protein [Paenibacillus]|uniref:hypothetical protein n=1 Tax=Paenibacillus TaxID=44249 RepID=UPI0022B89EF1|nr:hypothetical protein [Paenibacillus caseinilyticus]MCZ8517884.1 hypothetical protein [Paenibacillus caseinilyticus]